MSSSKSRKRSRWGDSSDQRQEPAAAPSHSSVSDQDAVNALLASAQARQEETKQQDRSTKKPRMKQEEKEEEVVPPEEQQKANFGLSGALAKDERAGNSYKGIVLKFSEPPEARAPNTQWRFYVFKNDKLLDTLHVSKQSAYLFGRNHEIADVPVEHPSLSSQHAVLQYRALPHKETGKLNCQPYLMDLESTNGTFINGVKIDAARYYQLKKGDVIKFGASTREYVLLTANTTSIK
jgi:smad nuclear-interacting protein 1